MNRNFLWTFAIISVSFVFWFCGFSEAQTLPSQPDAQSNISSKSATNQQKGPSQKQPRRWSEKNRRPKIPQPERNRLGERQTKKAVSRRKRKKLRRSGGIKTGRKKRNANTLSSENSDSNANRRITGQKELNVKTERIDDVPLLIKMMIKMGIQEAIDNHIRVQNHQRELSWGWTAVIWLAYILSEGDHRKVAVEQYIGGMQNTLTALTGMVIEEADFTDDRLTNLAKYLNQEELWHKIEDEISGQSIEAYELPEKTCRVDATTVSGYHETYEDGIFQFGHSKDDPGRAQIKVMTGCLDPLGMPLATDVVSGERADDGLYAPIISRISDMLQKKGVLYVGDCKLSSFDNRLHIKGKVKGHYLCPLPNTGRTSEEMEAWIAQGNLKDEKDELIKYVVETDQGEQELKAKGYEKEREQSAQIEGREIKWKERVLIVKSAAHEKQKKKGLERRLSNSEKKLNTLTPPRGPGKRQITDEAKLIESAQAILKKHRVEDFLTYEYVKEVERETKYVGRGRGSANRERKVTEKIRYQITKVERNEEKIAAQIKKYGWKAYVTDVPKERLGFIDVVQSYRKQYRVERIFNRLKSRLNIAPLYVKKKHQIKGITHLLTVGVRVYTLIEFVVRRSLQRSNEKLVGLHLENPKKATDIPTCERLLKAFSKITLTIIKVGDSDLQHLTPLSKLQTDILNHLGFDSSIYKNLEKLQI
jgi:transposase